MFFSPLPVTEMSIHEREAADAASPAALALEMGRLALFASPRRINPVCRNAAVRAAMIRLRRESSR
jgi:hypothetical protein